MKSVFIIRHGKSSWSDPSRTDLERPLNNRGKRASLAMGEFLSERGIRPDLVICSPALRARRTAEHICRGLGHDLGSIRIERCIYFDGHREILEMISRLDDSANCVFLVGHEPTSSYLVHSLCGEDVLKFPTAAAFGIRLKADQWREVPGEGGQKACFFVPKELGIPGL